MILIKGKYYNRFNEVDVLIAGISYLLLMKKKAPIESKSEQAS